MGLNGECGGDRDGLTGTDSDGLKMYRLEIQVAYHGIYLLQSAFFTRSDFCG